MSIDSMPHPLDSFRPIRLVDGHFHMMTQIKEEHLFHNLGELLTACGMQAINVLSLSARAGIEENLAAALCKAMYPAQVYAFGGLHYHLPGVPDSYMNLEDQARKLIAIGFDGLKLIEGKPNVRQNLGIPLDSPIYDGLFTFVQEEGLPVIYHVADPWQGTEPPQEIERVYQEIQRLLTRYPHLYITFAHFFFSSHRLEKAAELLDTYPNLCLDLTPHGDMYADFSKDPDRTRQFFMQYQDRIIFGTDNHGEPRSFPPGSPLEYWPVYKLIAMRTFLETDKSFCGWHYDLHGIALPPDVLEKIYHQNFFRLAGKQPRPLNAPLGVEECERILSLARRYAIIHEVLPGLKHFVEKLQAL